MLRPAGGGFLVPQVILVELAGAVLLAAAAGPRWVLVPAGVVAAALVLPAVVRYRQRRLAQWLPIRLASRRRSTGGPGVEWADPSISPLLENWPELRVTGHTDRDRRAVGLIGDGSFLTAVLTVDTLDEPLRPVVGTRTLPLGDLAAILHRDDVPLAAVQVVQHTQPTPATHLPAHSVAVRSHQLLGVHVPAIRATWIALRLEPERSRSAIEARGGGVLGARRALVTATQRLAADLTAHGLDAEPLTETELVGALGAACSVNPVVGTQIQSTALLRRTRELRRTWRCDDRWHATFWVSRWPRLDEGVLPALAARLTSGQVLATTVSLTMTAAPKGAVSLSGHVRVTGRSSDQLEEAARALMGQAHEADVGLVRLDGEQLPGLLATLPLGGVGGGALALAEVTAL